jgi:hypothetical protein
MYFNVFRVASAVRFYRFLYHGYLTSLLPTTYWSHPIFLNVIAVIVFGEVSFSAYRASFSPRGVAVVGFSLLVLHCEALLPSTKPSSWRAAPCRLFGTGSSLKHCYPPRNSQAGGPPLVGCSRPCVLYSQLHLMHRPSRNLRTRPATCYTCWGRLIEAVRRGERGLGRCSLCGAFHRIRANQKKVKAGNIYV